MKLIIKNKNGNKIQFAKGGIHLNAGLKYNESDLEHTVINGLNYYRQKGTRNQWLLGDRSGNGKYKTVRISSSDTYNINKGQATRTNQVKVNYTKGTAKKTAAARKKDETDSRVLRRERSGGPHSTQYNNAYKDFKSAYNAARLRGDEAFDYKGKVYYAFDLNERNSGSASGIKNYNMDDMEARYGANLGYGKDKNFGAKSKSYTANEHIQNALGTRKKFELEDINPLRKDIKTVNVPEADNLYALGSSGLKRTIYLPFDAALQGGKALFGFNATNPLTNWVNGITNDVLGNSQTGQWTNAFRWGKNVLKTNSTDENTRNAGYYGLAGQAVDAAEDLAAYYAPEISNYVGGKVKGAWNKTMGDFHLGNTPNTNAGSSNWGGEFLATPTDIAQTAPSRFAPAEKLVEYGEMPNFRATSKIPYKTPEISVEPEVSSLGRLDFVYPGGYFEGNVGFWKNGGTINWIKLRNI